MEDVSLSPVFHLTNACQNFARELDFRNYYGKKGTVFDVNYHYTITHYLFLTNFGENELFLTLYMDYSHL